VAVKSTASNVHPQMSHIELEPVAADHYNFSGNIDLSCNDFHYNKINFKQITAGHKIGSGFNYCQQPERRRNEWKF
jgi:hypothetical protein